MSKEKNLNSPIFICGCSRSGTTLLRNILGNHSNIYEIKGETFLFTNDKEFILRKLKSKLNEYKSLNKRFLVMSILTFLFEGGLDTIPYMEKNEFPLYIERMSDELLNSKDLNLLNDLYDVFDFCANYLTQKENKIRWVEKTPRNIFAVDFIIERYPDAKLIEIHRDPRAVYLSWKNTEYEYFEKSSALKAIITWRRSIDCGLKHRNILPNQYYQVHYQDLISSPANEIKRMCEFINEDFESQMLNTNVMNSFFEDTKSNLGFSTAGINRWEKLLLDNEKILVDLLTKKHRDILNYPDSNAKLTLSNLLPFLLFTTKTSIESRKEIEKILKSKMTLLIKGKGLKLIESKD